MILAALLDMIILPIPYQFLNTQWQVSFTTQVVDRGIIPLIGIALVLTGSWFEGGGASRAKARKGLSYWILILAWVLGIFYAILFPLHLNNVRLSAQTAIEQVNQEVSQTEAQIETRLQDEVSQRREQISQLLNNEEQLNAAIQSGQLPEDLAGVLQESQDNPAALDEYLQDRVGEFRNQLQTEIRMRQEAAESTARSEALKSGLRIGISSLLLAVGYIVVGATGLKGLKQTANRPKR